MTQNGMSYEFKLKTQIQRIRLSKDPKWNRMEPIYFNTKLVIIQVIAVVIKEQHSYVV